MAKSRFRKMTKQRYTIQSRPILATKLSGLSPMEKIVHESNVGEKSKCSQGTCERSLEPQVPEVIRYFRLVGRAAKIAEPVSNNRPPALNSQFPKRIRPPSFVSLAVASTQSPR